MMVIDSEHDVERNCMQVIATKFKVLAPVGIIVLMLSCAPLPATATQKNHNDTGMISFGGLDRTYRVHIPPSYDANRPAPLVIALHGGRGTGKKMERLSPLSQQSDKSGFIVAYPDAVGRNWNDSRSVTKYRSHRENIDDVGFVAALIDSLATQWNIDRRRVYVTGASNGALMSYRLACELADKITAIAAVIGSMAVNITATCAPSRPVPVLMINGTEDKLIPWDGGYVRFGRKTFGRILSVPDTASFWATHNGCHVTPEVTMLADVEPEDGTRVYERTYSGCNNGVAVVLYEIRGGGHTRGRRDTSTCLHSW
jgi:polyhydroxybutyrate depolymerase